MNKVIRTKIRKILEEYYDFYPDFLDPIANPNIPGFSARKAIQGKQVVGMNEEVIEEGALGFMDIPPTVGLVKIDGGYKSATYSLFDFKNKKCIGYISLEDFSERAYSLTNIASEKGFGPLMAEIGMMGVYSKGLTVDRNGPTKQKVWDMLKLFAESRGDIRKIVINKSDMEYDDRYLSEGDDNRQYIMNLIFLRTPSNWFNKLIDRGNRLSNEYEVTSSEIKDICRAYFSSKYENG